MKYKCVIADIDGTLVNERRELTVFTTKILHHYIDQGLWFGLASGRPVDELNRLETLWGFKNQFALNIGMNGAQLDDHILNKSSESNLLTTDTIKSILEYMKPFRDFAHPVIYYGHKIMSDQFNDLLAGSGKRAGKDILIAKTDKDFYRIANPKVMFRLPENRMDEIENYIKHHPLENCIAFKTQSTMIEFADPKTAKGVSVAKFMKDHDLSDGQVAIFGDTSNDNSMLSLVKSSVCLYNGSADTKAIANIVTPLTNDEDGFAHMLIHLMQD